MKYEDLVVGEEKLLFSLPRFFRNFLQVLSFVWDKFNYESEQVMHVRIDHAQLEDIFYWRCRQPLPSFNNIKLAHFVPLHFNFEKYLEVG